jgi:FKBP-type peptidyl-prolyl cis-trans isomerase SlyD
MVNIKKGDFVEIEYTGKVKEDNTIFDTTDETKAKQLGIHNKQMNYGPVTICVGQHQVIKGLDDQLIGKELKSYNFDIKPEDGFGKKNPKLLKIVPISLFRKEKIQPVIGLQVTTDGVLGTVRSVTGGRVVLDFNHPLSGRELNYDVKVNKIITDKKTQIKSYLKVNLNRDADVSIENDQAKITMDVPEETKEKISKKLTELVKLKKIDFIKPVAVKTDKPDNKEVPKKA